MLGPLGRDFSAWLDRVPVADPFERRQARSLQIFTIVILIDIAITEIARAFHPDRPSPPENVVTAAITVSRCWRSW